MIRVQNPAQASHIGGALAAARGRHPVGTVSRLAMPELTVGDRRSILLVTAEHSTAGEMRDTLLELCSAGHATRYQGQPATAASLFTQLRIAVQRLEKVKTGEIAPAEVLAAHDMAGEDSAFTDTELADGTAKAAAIDRCELDVLDVLELLAPGLPRAPEDSDEVPPGEILPGW